LLRAGLVPALRDTGLTAAVMLPGEHPLDTLTKLGPADVVVIDQFEEVWALCRETDECTKLMGALGSDEYGSVVFVLGLRADFYVHAAREPALHEALNTSSVLVGSLSGDAVRAAIVEPARKAGWTVADDLVHLLTVELAPRGAAAAHDAGALPLLSHALLETWSHARKRRMTVADYNAVGGIAGAIEQTGETVYGALDDKQQQLSRRVFLRLVAVDDDTVTRRRVHRSELNFGDGSAGDVSAVLDRLARQRLLTIDEETVEISHEALIGAWGRLRGWVDDDRAGLIVHRRLTQAEQLWHDSGQDTSALLGPARLTVVREWMASSGHDLDLNQREREYVTASVAHQEEIAAREREAGQARERAAREHALALRRRARILFVLAVVSAVIAIAAGVGFRQATTARHRADDQARQALAQRLMDEGSTILQGRQSGDDIRALQEILAAHALVPGSSTDAAIVDAMYARRHLLSVGKTHIPATSVGFSPDRRTMAIGDQDGTVRLWDLATGRQIGAPLGGNTKEMNTVAFSPDGKLLVSGCADGTIRLWDVATGRQIGTPWTGHANNVWSLAFSPDGRMVVSGGGDHTIRLWDVATGRQDGASLTGHTDWVNAVAFSPDGTRIASGGEDNVLRLWDVATRQQIGAPLTGHTRPVWRLAFSPDGARIVSASLDNTLRIWDAHTGQQIGVPLSGHSYQVVSVAFSPDSKQIVSGGDDKTVRLWDANTGREIGAPLRGHSDSVIGVAFGSDGKQVYSTSFDMTVRAWSTTNLALTGHTEPVTSVAISPDGKRIASGSDDMTIRLWDATTGQPIGAPMAGHTAAVRSVAFSPDGNRIASGSDDMTIRLWDATTGQPIGAPLIGHTDHVLSVAFSPDGNRIVSGSDDWTVRLWDIATGQPVRDPPPRAHAGTVWAVAFSPDGQHFASGGTDNTVRIWDAAADEPIGAPLTGHIDPVLSVAFSPDGRRIVSGSMDDTIRLWSVAAGGPVGAPLTGHTESVTAVAFSPDGQLIVSGSDDDTVQLWHVLQPSAAQLCAKLTSNPSRKQWQDWVSPYIPYMTLCPGLPISGEND
jgi:WD40 repeat protein